MRKCLGCDEIVSGLSYLCTDCVDTAIAASIFAIDHDLGDSSTESTESVKTAA